MKERDDELWGIIYLSAATQHFTHEEMKSIVKEVKSDCRSKSISGIILYSEGNVLAFMEGPKEVISLHYQQMLNDVRHKNLIKLFDSPISSRYFEDLGMTFNFLDNKIFKQLGDFNTPENSAYLKARLNMDDMVMRCIFTFIKNNK